MCLKPDFGSQFLFFAGTFRCRSWEMVRGTSCLPAMVCGSFWTMKMFLRSSIATGQHLFRYFFCFDEFSLWDCLTDTLTFETRGCLQQGMPKELIVKEVAKVRRAFDWLVRCCSIHRSIVVGLGLPARFDRLPKQSGRRDRHVEWVLQHLIPSQKCWKSDS